MQQKIFTYFYPLKDDEVFHCVDENLEGMLADGWQAVSGVTGGQARCEVRHL